MSDSAKPTPPQPLCIEPVAPDLLRKIPLFERFEEHECQQVAAVASCQTFAAEETILRQGNVSKNLWVVLEGKCDVVKVLESDPRGQEIILAVLEPYENFGEMSFFQDAPHSAGVRARTPVKLLRITREAFDGLVNGGCWAAYKVTCTTVESLANRLRRMDDWVAKLLRESEQEARVHEWSGFRDKLFKQWSV